MSNTVKIVNNAALQEAGTKALIKELGVTGMLRYLEQYDNGDIDDIHKLRKYNYHVTQPMTVCEKMEFAIRNGE